MDPKLLAAFLADAWPFALAIAAGAFIGWAFTVWRHMRKDRREYLRGCRDTERLIRARILSDLRDDSPLPPGIWAKR